MSEKRLVIRAKFRDFADSPVTLDLPFAQETNYHQVELESVELISAAKRLTSAFYLTLEGCQNSLLILATGHYVNRPILGWLRFAESISIVENRPRQLFLPALRALTLSLVAPLESSGQQSETELLLHLRLKS